MFGMTEAEAKKGLASQKCVNPVKKHHLVELDRLEHT